MTLDKDDLINSIMASIDRINNIKIEDMPNIDLYMDQVTTFMEERLKASSRHPGEDKILTKTMINNYAKNDLLPPPDKKKYNREHLVMLIFIYYSKGILSISDIQTMLGPIADGYFNSDGDINLCKIYEEVFKLEGDEMQKIKDDILAKSEMAKQTFTDYDKKDRDVLQLFSFVFMLGYDVYVKKLLIEKLLDIYGEHANNDKSDKKSKDEKPQKNKKSKQ